MKIVSLKKVRVTCKRCGHVWVPRVEAITVCARCKSPYWDRERKEKGKK